MIICLKLRREVRAREVADVEMVVVEVGPPETRTTGSLRRWRVMKR